MKKLTTLLSLFLCFVIVLSFVGCSNNEKIDKTDTDIAQNETQSPEDNKETETIPSDTKNEGKDEADEKQPSILSQEEDGFYFVYNKNQIKLPMKYTDFIEKTNATVKTEVPEKIFSHESQYVKLTIDGAEATIVVMGNEFNKEISFQDASVISIEMPITDNIEFKKGVKNNFTKSRIISRYGEPDFGNASLYEEYLYYSLPFDSFDDHVFGLELTYSNKTNDKSQKTKDLAYFKYGSLHIEYIQQ